MLKRLFYLGCHLLGLIAFIALESWLMDHYNNPVFYGEAALSLLFVFLAFIGYIQILFWFVRRIYQTFA